MPQIVTIERHILDQQKRFPQATGALTGLLYDMALSGKLISRETNRAGLVGILGAADGVNVYGEQQQRLDMFADDVIFKMNDHTGRLCVMASEEHDDIMHIPDEFDCGNYALLYDPLDGSSNIDVNVSVGTIFAIQRKISAGERGALEDVLQPGRRLVAAGYMVYGSSTMMVYSAGQGVHGFTLDPSVGEFLLSHPDIRIPAKPRYYSSNQGYQKVWTPGVRRFCEWLQALDDDEREPLGARYVGSMVTDFHRNLLYGGVFFYPGDMQQPAKPNGKMRLLFEAQALAFLAEQAGGYASDGIGDILDIQPHSLHQRVPLFIGNRDLVETAESFIREHDQDWLEAYRPFREGRR
ncbi:MAG: class 1 fructose-bisphosphatase [Burkholderiales bacterium]|nr:class 1 fructose-bisphosphatase [Anaerolineae bacterium]